MKAIENGEGLVLLPGSRIIDSIPVGTYYLKPPGNHMPPVLVPCENLKVTVPKVYGGREKILKHIFEVFNDTAKNIGVLLTGEKGAGKTLFSKGLAEEAIKQGMLVIRVENNFDGIDRYIEAIDQKALILMDEFDKNFTSNNKDDSDRTAPQDGLLTLLDGLAVSHKLFVATANNVGKLNTCMLNRPGRFRYHLRFGPPSVDEVKEFLKDNMSKEILDAKLDDINKLVRLQTLSPKTLDCIKAIVDELCYGLSLSEALAVLNIGGGDTSELYKLRVKYRIGGKECVDSGGNHTMNILNPDDYDEFGMRIKCRVQDPSGKFVTRVAACVSVPELDVVSSGVLTGNGGFRIPLEKCDVTLYDDANPIENDEELDEKEKAIYESNENILSSLEILEVTVEKSTISYHINPDAI